MPSKLTINDDVPEVTVNVVPVKIQYNGEANTSAFFSPSKSREDFQGKEVTTANFRGLKLLGEEVDLDGMTGFVCNASEFLVQEDGTDNVKTCKQYTPVAKFDALTLYGHDCLPSSEDKWKVMSEWQAISKVLNE